LSKGYQAATEQSTAGRAEKFGSVRMTEDPGAVEASLKFGAREVDGSRLAQAEYLINHALYGGEGEYNPQEAVKYVSRSGDL
jgi:hypothetical protein